MSDGQQEPSMEDILQSIRKILADEGDEEKKQAAPESKPEPAADFEPEPEPAPEPEPEEDIDELVLEDEEPQELEFDEEPEELELDEPEEELELDDMLDFEEIPDEEEPKVEPEPEPAMPALYDDEDDEPLISNMTESSATGTISELAQAVAKKRAVALGVNAGHATLEDLVRDMLRPLLKEWLDENLPYMIERLVKKEIERIVNRAEDL